MRLGPTTRGWIWRRFGLTAQTIHGGDGSAGSRRIVVLRAGAGPFCLELTLPWTRKR